MVTGRSPRSGRNTPPAGGSLGPWTSEPRRPHRARRVVALLLFGALAVVVVRALRVDPVSPGADTWPPVPEKGGMTR